MFLEPGRERHIAIFLHKPCPHMISDRAFKRVALGPFEPECLARLLLRRRHEFRGARNARNRRNLAAIRHSACALGRNLHA